MSAAENYLFCWACDTHHAFDDAYSPTEQAWHDDTAEDYSTPEYHGGTA